MDLTMYFSVFDENEQSRVLSQKTQKAQMVDLNAKLGFGISLENFIWGRNKNITVFSLQTFFWFIVVTLATM